MGHELDFELPVHGDACDDSIGAGCDLKAYVSNEEASILASMRELKAEADAVKLQRSQTDSPQEREIADQRLGELRRSWARLAEKREQAFKRKMIMLGHLPPDDEIELF